MKTEEPVKIEIIKDSEFKSLLHSKPIDKPQQSLLDRINTLINRKGEKRRLKLTIGDAFRLGRFMKPKHLVGALWHHTFSENDERRSSVGEVCHQGALAWGFGQWDNIGSTSEYWPDGVPKPAVDYPCEHSRDDQEEPAQTVDQMLMHLADVHPPLNARDDPNEYGEPWSQTRVAEWLDTAIPGEYDTGWFYYEGEVTR